MTTEDEQTDLDPYSEPETYPVLMVYCTIRLSSRGGWTQSVRIMTPDGAGAIDNRGTSGGNVAAGKPKMIKRLEDALDVAFECLDPFPLEDRFHIA